MKANELMIGDWVKPQNVDSYFKVGLIGADSIWNNTDTAEWDLDEIEPIPLTPEILEKNGFSGEYKKSYQINNYKDIDIAYISYWKGRLTIRIKRDIRNIHSGIKMHIDCNYVHELQHVLRLCEIDKTIEL